VVPPTQKTHGEIEGAKRGGSEVRCRSGKRRSGDGSELDGAAPRPWSVSCDTPSTCTDHLWPAARPDADETIKDRTPLFV